MPSIIDDAVASDPTQTPTPTNNTQPASSIANVETTQPPAAGVATYKPTEVPDPSEWTVTPDQTVAGNVAQVVDPNSPLMVQAKTRAQQASNERGLINSSIAASAGEAAMLDAAVPIAQADAATKAKAAGYTADIKNQTNVTNTNLRNSADQFNASQINTQQLQNLAKENEVLVQTNSQAGQLLSNATSAINNIANNNQMDAATKTEQSRQIYDNLKLQLGILGSVSKLNLTSLLTTNPYA